MRTDRTDELRAVVTHAKRRGHVAMLDEAIDYINTALKDLAAMNGKGAERVEDAKAILFSLREVMAQGLNWSPASAHKEFIPPADASSAGES